MIGATTYGLMPPITVVVFMLQPRINAIAIIVSNCNCMGGITVYQALDRMRELTAINVPFSMEFITYSDTTSSSKGLRRVSKALLRTGLSREKSDKSDILIGFTEEPEESPRWFYLPLLLKFNGIPVRP